MCSVGVVHLAGERLPRGRKEPVAVASTAGSPSRGQSTSCRYWHLTTTELVLQKLSFHVIWFRAKENKDALLFVRTNWSSGFGCPLGPCLNVVPPLVFGQRVLLRGWLHLLHLVVIHRGGGSGGVAIGDVSQHPVQHKASTTHPTREQHRTAKHRCRQHKTPSRIQHQHLNQIVTLLATFSRVAFPASSPPLLKNSL